MSGSTPLKALSKVARETPIACASGHSASRNLRKASALCAAARPGAIARRSTARPSTIAPATAGLDRARRHTGVA